VADYRPEQTAGSKIKKRDDTLTMTLVKNPDILQSLGERKQGQFLVGFAAETDALESNALEKLRRKRCDLLVANDVTQAGAGFGVDTNAVKVFDSGGLAADFPVMPKTELARRLAGLIAERLDGSQTPGGRR